jgi:hypothetical protein
MPRAGGMLDQDSRMMYFLIKIQEFDGIRAEFDEQQNKQRSTM